MSIYNVNKNGDKCYNPITKRWGACDENTTSRRSPSPSPAPATCCIPTNCCFDCDVLLELLNCFSVYIKTTVQAGDFFTTISIRELSALTMINNCNNITIESDAPDTPPYFLYNNGIKYDCITDIYITNELVNISDGDSIVQCVIFESNCFQDVGICFELSATLIGPSLMQGDANLFRLCLNPTLVGTMNQCQYCYP